MSDSNLSTTPAPAPRPDPYSIECEGPECVYVLRYNGAYVDEGYCYSEVESYRLLHSALMEAEQARHDPAYMTHGAAGLAMLEAEQLGYSVTPVWCDQCQGWHLEEGH